MMFGSFYLKHAVENNFDEEPCLKALMRIVMPVRKDQKELIVGDFEFPFEHKVVHNYQHPYVETE